MKILNSYKNLFKIFIIISICFFFSKEIAIQLSILRNFKVNIDYIYLFESFLLIISSFLCATLGWHSSHSASKNKFLLNFGLLNISQLLKYIPGKLWSYIIQVNYFKKNSISSLAGIAANVLMIVSLSLSSLLISSTYFYFFGNFFNKFLLLGLLIFLLVAYLFLVFGGSFSINLVLILFNKFFKKNITLRALTPSEALIVHSYYFISNLLFGFGGYFLALSLGVKNELNNMAFIGASILFSDTASYFVFLTPAGIGIREGIIFFLFKSMFTIDIAIVLPLLFRLLTMANDLIFGLLSFFYLHNLKK